VPPLKCDNILIVRTDRIGDVVLTTPVFKALRKAYPAARICVLVSPATADLVRGNPYIDEVLIDDRHGIHRGPIGVLRLAREIRRRNFDTAFIFHTKRRTNGTCFLAGIPRRIGYKNNKFGLLLTKPVKDLRDRGEKHEAEYCLDLLRSVGIEGGEMDLLVPLHREAESWASAWFEAAGARPGELVAIHPGASDPAKCWPAESFARLADALISRYKVQVVLIGGKETAGTAAGILSSCLPGVLDLVGKTTVAQTASVLRRCRLLISSDSGPVHLGAGAGTHVISLFLRDQPGINPRRWRPLGPRSFTLANANISVEDVLEIVERIFSKNNQSMFYW